MHVPEHSGAGSLPTHPSVQVCDVGRVNNSSGKQTSLNVDSWTNRDVFILRYNVQRRRQGLGPRCSVSGCIWVTIPTKESRQQREGIKVLISASFHSLQTCKQMV